MIPAVRMLIVIVAGACLGSLVNWAIYALAWTPRPISPWSPATYGAAPRGWLDRIPIFGWLKLRREAPLFGRRFWVRPMLLELGFGIALAALYWWEVFELGLVRGQVLVWIAPVEGPLHWQFFSHVILFCLMLAASVIDIDEKIVPDEVTVPGTVFGLIFATLLPMSLLPDVAERQAPQRPVVGAPLLNRAGAAALGPAGDPLWVEPVTSISPNTWPPQWGNPRNWQSLAIALGCYSMWCFALAPRIWRGRRGTVFALRLIIARVMREFSRPPLGWFLIGGTAWVALTWLAARQWPGSGAAAWCGLFTSLVGLAASGGIVWAVRLIGTFALRREAMGFGDVTFMMMVGTFLGWQACLITFFLAPFAGVLLGLLQFVLRRDDVIPFVPYLALAAAATVVAWAGIWNWAEQMFAFGWLVPTVLVICLAMLGVMLTIWRMIKTVVFGHRA
jgi:prepilin signal peptidase PulO-like enzyme (type II secretory pathway)